MRCCSGNHHRCGLVTLGRHVHSGPWRIIIIILKCCPVNARPRDLTVTPNSAIRERVTEEQCGAPLHVGRRWAINQLLLNRSLALTCTRAQTSTGILSSSLGSNYKTAFANSTLGPNCSQILANCKSGFVNSALRPKCSQVLAQHKIHLRQ